MAVLRKADTLERHIANMAPGIVMGAEEHQNADEQPKSLFTAGSQASGQHLSPTLKCYIGTVHSQEDTGAHVSINGS